ncbi:hypothetical protein QQ008_07290 [Fulvivirgaceae bacterium BMA10]|uniref:Uncharacterized protein n=1 Tax=Splendidivirga corallicola TaxID=3051826 RepID=A0ABT8KLQ1_9BACT|nr:hypothetical protein [Fulvivirgaceae bacterium BMA10]
MIKLEENKSKIWFKILNCDGSPIDGSAEVWSLPHGESKGELTTFPGEPSRKLSPDGIWYVDPTYKDVSWLVSSPTPLYKLNSGLKIYVVQILDSPFCEEPGMIWVSRAYLLREATNLDLKPFGIYRSFKQVIE